MLKERVCCNRVENEIKVVEGVGMRKKRASCGDEVRSHAYIAN